MKKQIKILIFFFLLFGIIIFSPVSAQNETSNPVEKLGNFLTKFWENFSKEAPEVLKRKWKEEVLPIWKRMGEWFNENIFKNIKSKFLEEVEKRKLTFEQELEKEKLELKREIPKVGKSLLEKIRDFLRGKGD